MWHFGGGQRGSIPVGVTTGMLNQLGSTLVLQFIPLLNFTSAQKKNALSVVLIFFLYYYNMVLLPLIFSKDYGVKEKQENLFSEKNWYEIFSRSIYISLILTSFLPYVFGAFMGWFI